MPRMAQRIRLPLNAARARAGRAGATRSACADVLGAVGSACTLAATVSHDSVGSACITAAGVLDGVYNNAVAVNPWSAGAVIIRGVHGDAIGCDCAAVTGVCGARMAQ